MTPERPKNFKALRKEMLTLDEISVRMASMTKAGDYEAAMISSSLLEFTLRQMLLTSFVAMSNADVDGLIDRPGAPLATLSAKISLSFALGFISENVRTQLNRVKDIRNHFGHHKDVVSFDHPSVAAECTLLTAYRSADLHQMKWLSLKEWTAKERYVQTCFWTVYEFSAYIYNFGEDHQAPLPIDCF